MNSRTVERTLGLIHSPVEPLATELVFLAGIAPWYWVDQICSVDVPRQIQPSHSDKDGCIMQGSHKGMLA